MNKQAENIEDILAVLLGIFIVLVISIVSGVLAGFLVSWGWNTFLVPNIETELPIISWWQAALGLIGIRLIVGLVTPSRF